MASVKAQLSFEQEFFIEIRRAVRDGLCTFLASLLLFSLLRFDGGTLIATLFLRSILTEAHCSC